MKKRLSFYVIILLLVVIDAILLANPNILGKIGLIIYKYHYLRTFPRTLLTVGIVAAIALVIGEGIGFLVRARMLTRKVASILLMILIVICLAMLVKTMMDFSTWAYGHTGRKFKYGAYLLPVILDIIFAAALFALPRPLAPDANELAKDETITNKPS